RARCRVSSLDRVRQTVRRPAQPQPIRSRGDLLMARNLQATRTRVHRQIARWGTRACLRREGVDRAGVAGFIKVRPVDKSLVVEGQHEVLISAIDPDTAQPLALPP